jgi:hypothetical protein
LASLLSVWSSAIRTESKKTGENRASRTIWEQNGLGGRHLICTSGVPRVSSLSFPSLPDRICTPGPGDGRVRRFTFNFNDQQPGLRRIRERRGIGEWRRIGE